MAAALFLPSWAKVKVNENVLTRREGYNETYERMGMVNLHFFQVPPHGSADVFQAEDGRIYWIHHAREFVSVRLTAA